jgi:hypothetical protein
MKQSFLEQYLIRQLIKKSSFKKPEGSLPWSHISLLSYTNPVHIPFFYSLKIYFMDLAGDIFSSKFRTGMLHVGPISYICHAG